MRLLRPDLMEWWLVVPLVLVAWGLHYAYRQFVRRRAGIAPRFEHLSRRSGLLRSVTVLVACLIGAGSLIFALTRPQIFFTRRTPQYDQQDLIILLDRSQSMRAHDIFPSRFSRATLEIKNFLQNKPEAIGRVGLVSFAGTPVILSYLTGDLGIIGFYMDWANRDIKPQYGTDIGAALDTALDVTQKNDIGNKKIFLLISDGEDHGQELQDAIANYRRAGFRINCIGIGSQNEVVIPLIVDRKGKEIPMVDAHGNPMRTLFEEETLRSIARATGGQYIRSTTGEQLTPAIENIIGQERRIVGYKTSTEASELYPVGLAIAGMAGAALWLLL